MTEAAEESKTGPDASGVRVTWEQMPGRVRREVETWLGSPVVRAISQASGFSPGVAARMLTADGRRVFLKAISPHLNPDSPAFHRREIAVVSLLPEDAPVPRLLWSLDEGPAGWIVLVFEEIAGAHPEMPWRDDEIARVMAALEQLSEELTPSPVAESAIGSVSDSIFFAGAWWSRIREQNPEGLDDWSRRNLDELVECESGAPDAVRGETLLHLDLRADNLLLGEDRVYVIDWPHARVGAAWLDVVGFAPSVQMQGGPQPEALMGSLAAARAADPRAITAAVAAITGFFIHESLQPPPPGLPTLRAFQAAQGEIAREWLARRTGLE